MAPDVAVPLVGRDPELNLLRDLAVGVADGRGQAVLVSGEAGMGKSALLATIGQATSSNCRVYRGTAGVGGRGSPLRPLVEALGVAESSADARRAHIARILNSWSATDAPEDRAYEAAELMLDLVVGLCAESPVALVVDNLHRADDTTVVAWRRLARMADRLPLLVVGAARPAPDRPELMTVRLELSARGGVIVDLKPLTAEEIEELAGRLAGAPPGPRLRALVARAAGAPGAVIDLVDALRQEHVLLVRDGRADVDPDGDTLAILTGGEVGQRLRALSAETAEVLRHAAVLGQEFSVAELASVTGRPATDLVPALEEGTAAGVLDESGARLAFRHAPLRQVLLDTMRPETRTEACVRAMRVLDSSGSPAQRVGEQIRTAVAMGVGWDAWMLGWLELHAAQLGHRSPALAAQLAESALGAESATDTRRDALAAAQMRALWLLSRYDETERIARRVLATASEPSVRAQAMWTLGDVLMAGGQLDDARVVVDHIALPEGDVWAARLLALLAGLDAARDAYDPAGAMARAALAQAQRIGDRLGIGYARLVLSHVCARTGSPADALVQLDDGLTALGDEPTSVDLQLRFAIDRVEVLTRLDRPSAARQVAAEASATAHHAGLPNRSSTLRLLTAELDFNLGRWDDAVAELESVHDGDVWQRLRGAGLLALIAAHRGSKRSLTLTLRDLPEAHLATLVGSASVADAATLVGSASVADAATLVGSASVADTATLVGSASVADEARGDEGTRDGTGPGLRLRDLAFAHWARAIAAEQEGKPDEALAMLRVAVEPRWAVGLGHASDDGRIWWLPRLARAALAAEDGATARSAVEAAEADSAGQPSRAHRAVADLCRGMVGGDADQVLAAAEEFGHLGYIPYVAFALEEAAVALARAGTVVDARLRLAGALQAYAELRAAASMRRAHDRLRPYGVESLAGRPRRITPTGWDSLTATERRIATLVAEGHSNPNIATELFLSPKTVMTYVSRIFVKLGVRSRAEIAREAATRAHHEPR